MRVVIALFVLCMSIPVYVYAAPTISGVSGIVLQGQTLTIVGTDLIKHNKTNWRSPFADNDTTWSFEGENSTADGYDNAPGHDYDNNVALFGNKSIKFNVTGEHITDCVEHPAGDYNFVYIAGDYDHWMRGYVRWNVVAGAWPTSYIKMSMWNPSPYFQPLGGGDGSHPEKWFYTWTNDGVHVGYPDIGETLQNNKWYLFEAHIKYDEEPKIFEAWINGSKLVEDYDEPATTHLNIFKFGVMNLCGTSAEFDLDHWWDGLVVSSSRVYAATLIEVSNNAVYGAGTTRYQTPTYLGETSSSFVLDVTGLGPPPYYLWVTNNSQEQAGTVIGRSESAPSVGFSGGSQSTTITGGALSTTFGN